MANVCSHQYHPGIVVEVVEAQKSPNKAKVMGPEIVASVWHFPVLMEPSPRHEKQLTVAELYSLLAVLWLRHTAALDRSEQRSCTKLGLQSL